MTKPGFKTSEFWLTVLQVLAAVKTEDTVTRITAGIILILYVWSRIRVKEHND